MDQDQEKKNNSFFPFKFKNEATIKAILQAISTNEGILPNQLDQYLEMAHARYSGPLFIEMKDLLKKFWKEHAPMNLTELLGLTEFALTDIKCDVIKGGDKYEKMMKKRGF